MLQLSHFPNKTEINLSIVITIGTMLHDHYRLPMWRVSNLECPQLGS